MSKVRLHSKRVGGETVDRTPMARARE